MQHLNTRNPLLVHDDVGKAPRTCYDLPGPEFAYGKPQSPDLEGAREVTMHWAPHDPSKKECFAGPNFIQLNKKSVQDKISMAEARAQQERQQRSKGAKPLKTTENLIKYSHKTPMKASFTYGKPCRPSTPIASVVCCQYAAEEEIARNIDYQNYEAHKKNTKQKEVLMTKSTEGHAAGAARRIAKLAEKSGEPKEAFKLSKFKKIKSRVGDTGMRNPDIPTPKPITADQTPAAASPTNEDGKERKDEGIQTEDKGS